MTDYITKFEEEIIDAIEGNKTVKDSLLNYLQVFKYPNVERVTYDRNEQIYKNQIVPYMGKLIVSNITGADIKRLISTLTDKGYSFSTVKQTYNLLNEYFDYLMREESDERCADDKKIKLSCKAKQRSASRMRNDNRIHR